MAFSIQANPGVYALLVGSGVSRAAGMPTGWEVTLDLVRKLAMVHGEDCEPNPEDWYRRRFCKPPDYSYLVEELAKTPSERQQLLRQYWEPDATDREEKKKQPTSAHRAIAKLAGAGFLKVIVTTNFDRLIETALLDAGVTTTVLSSPDQVQGALPLVHTSCCVFKLHGDYLDTRLRNTAQELDHYPPEYDRLLDQILDEFGLVVCGWSAEWDVALCRALYRAPYKRFSTYWTVRGKIGMEAGKLIEHRGALTINIEGADAFFASVQENVQSIAEVGKTHPLSTAVAVESLKRYLPEPRHRIRLSDLVRSVVGRAAEVKLDETSRASGAALPTKESINGLVRRYDASCSTLMAIAAVGGAWAEEEHYNLWGEALESLGSRPSISGYTVWIDLLRYPATLLLYSLGIGAVSHSRFDFVEYVLSKRIRGANRERELTVQALPPLRLLGSDSEMMRHLEGMERRKLPVSDWIHGIVRPHAETILPDEERYTRAFDQFEILIALKYAQVRKSGSDWLPVGAFAYRDANREEILGEIEEALSTEGENSVFVRCGLIGETVEGARTAVAALRQWLSRLGYGL
ncbi:MAG: SIR2 family protein [Acidobacteriota bacterium]|nr:SIR2 family protein [Acidobacteriota bacterium]